MIPLDPETKKMVDEVFAGQVCHKCDKQAVRLRRGLFCCEDHIPVNHRKVKPVKVIEVKDPKIHGGF